MIICDRLLRCGALDGSEAFASEVTGWVSHKDIQRKPIMVMPKRLGCPFCQFHVLAVDEVLEDGSIRWRCLDCGCYHYKLWRFGEFAAEEYDSL